MPEYSNKSRYFTLSKRGIRKHGLILWILPVLLLIPIMLLTHSENRNRNKDQEKKTAALTQRLLKSKYNQADSITIGEIHNSFFKEMPHIKTEYKDNLLYIYFSQDIKIGNSEVWTKLGYLIDPDKGVFKPSTTRLRNLEADHMTVISTLRSMREYKRRKGRLPFTGEEFAKLAKNKAEDTQKIIKKLQSVFNRVNELHKTQRKRDRSALGAAKTYRDCSIEETAKKSYRIVLKEDIGDCPAESVIFADYSDSVPVYHSIHPGCRKYLDMIFKKEEPEWQFLETPA